MTDEIIKLYENAGIKKKYCGWLDMGDLDCQMQYIICESLKEWEELVFSSRFGKTEEEPEFKYPPFTAEKQLDLIIFIINKFGTLTFFDYEKFTREVMAEKLSKLLNSHWQDLSDVLKQQVKGILE